MVRNTKNLSNTKIKVNKDAELIVRTLRKNGYINTSINFVNVNVDNSFVNYIYVDNERFYPLYSTSAYNRLTHREITLEEVIEDKIKRIKLKQDTTASKKAGTSRKKYVTKNTPLVPKDWVAITDTEEIAIINMISPNGIYYVVPITGDNPGRMRSVRKERIERFRGSITIKA